MARRREKLTVSQPKTWAAGIPGVAGAMSDSLHEMGPARTLTTLRALNQRRRLRLPGLRLARARRQAPHRASSARTAPRRSPRRRPRRRIGADFFAEHSRRRPARAQRLLARPAGPADRSRWCTAPGADHYEPISWDDAFDLIADELTAPRRAPTRPSSTPRAAPATRPRSCTSCSSARSAPTTCRTARTCATSRAASALTETIGIGKGSVTLDDFDTGRPASSSSARTPAPTTRACSPRCEKAKEQRRAHRRGQPAARGGSAAVQESADARRASSGRHRSSPTTSSRSGSTATWPCSRRSTGAARGRGSASPAASSTTPSSPSTPTASTSSPRHLRKLDWDDVSDATGLSRGRDRRARRARHSPPTASSSAGRWA